MTAPLTPVHSEPSWQDHQDPSATAATCSSSSSSSDTFINFFQLGVSPFAYGADVGSLDLHQLLDSSYCLPLLQLHHHHHHQQQQQQQQQSSHFALPPLSSIDTVTPYFGTTDLFSVPPSASASPMPPYPPYPRLIESKVVSLQTKSQSPEQQKQQQQQQIHSITSPMDTFLTKPLKPARAHMEAGGKRFRPTKAQVDWLKRKFEETPNPKSDEMRRLSDESGIEILKLRVWFQNKRTRSK
ncbi:hypothetical protein BJ741DRAFT_445233 [Chytriomyces cf. hyalinus JEL632]|nr:hypothetical protein BJ741DRAFT_445233 [Chytriomyces cf. hyalinus JEL632]